MWETVSVLSFTGTIFEMIGILWYLQTRGNIDKKIFEKYVYGNSPVGAYVGSKELRKDHDSQNAIQIIVGFGLVLQLIGILYQVYFT